MNVVTASVLRGMVEKALADLLAFFQVNVAGNGNDTVASYNRPSPEDCCQGDNGDEREHPSKASSGGGGGHSVDSAAGIEVGQASELYPQENNACRGPPVIKENKACAGPPVLKVMFVVVKVAYILGIPPGFPL